MCRVGDARMMQTRDEIAEPLVALHLRPQRQAPAAVDAFLGDLVAVVYRLGRLFDSECADSTGQVAHVVAAHRIVLIADAVGLDVAAGQQ